MGNPIVFQSLEEAEEALKGRNPSIFCFPFSRTLNKFEEISLLGKIENFLSRWEAHGHALQAFAMLLHQQILMVLVDEAFSAATGCSKDKLFRTIETWARENSVSLAPRHLIPIFEADKLHWIPAAQCRHISPESRIINLSVSDWLSFLKDYHQPILETSLSVLHKN